MTNITRDDFLALEGKIDQINEKVCQLTTDMVLVKDYIVGNGHSGALEDIDDLESRVESLEKKAEYHKGLFNLSAILGIVVSSAVILNRLGII